MQQHDAEVVAENRKDNYFVAPRFYCVETICAPCGVVVAWTLFDKSEFPTKILDWLKDVYLTVDLRCHTSKLFLQFWSIFGGENAVRREEESGIVIREGRP